VISFYELSFAVGVGVGIAIGIAIRNRNSFFRPRYRFRPRFILRPTAESWKPTADSWQLQSQTLFTSSPHPNRAETRRRRIGTFRFVLRSQAAPSASQ